VWENDGRFGCEKKVKAKKSMCGKKKGKTKADEENVLKGTVSRGF
jgi:hypothetical protein